MPTIRLAEIAHARSGDKGNHANIGVIAWTRSGYAWLVRELTAEKVERHFASLAPTKVERSLLPGIGAVNFVLRDILSGGASLSLRSDCQGKTLALALLEMRVETPVYIGSMRRSAAETG